MMDVAGTHLFPHGKHLCFLLPGGPFLGSRKLFFVDGGLSLLPASRDPSSPFSLKSFAVLTLLFCVCKLYSVAWSCPALCDPMDCSPPGSSVRGILQARRLEWVAISSSRGSSRPRDGTHVSCIFCIGRQIVYHRATVLLKLVDFCCS